MTSLTTTSKSERTIPPSTERARTAPPLPEETRAPRRRGHSRLSAFFRFSPVAPFVTAARFTAFAGAVACTPTATFESAVPSGAGDTWRPFVAGDAERLFSDVREDAEVEVGYVFGVDGWRGCEDGSGEDDLELTEEMAAAAVVVVFGGGAAGADVAEAVVGLDADAGSEGASDLEGVLNSTGRTWKREDSEDRQRNERLRITHLRCGMHARDQLRSVAIAVVILQQELPSLLVQRRFRVGVNE